MAEIKSDPTKKILDICSGLSYKFGIKKINGEFTIYKNLGNGYDIVVSGLNNSGKKISAEMTVRILYPEIKVVETNSNISSIEQLDLLLIITVEKYLSMQDETEYMHFLFDPDSK